MFVQIKNKQLSSDKNYNFFFIVNEKLDSKNEFFAHVMKSNVKTIQIQNISKKFYVLSKNLKIEYVKNYTKQDCYMISSKNKHETIIIKKNSLFRKLHE